MKYRFLEKDYKIFERNLEIIINSIENNLKNKGLNTDIVIIINKLHFYAQEFFVNNEMNYRTNSDALTFMKNKRTAFVKEIKRYQKNISNDEKGALLGLKEFLQNWISEHNILENV